MENLQTLQSLSHTLAGYDDRPAVLALQKEEMVCWSYGQLADHARQITAGLLEAGVQPGDQVALLAGNSPEWLAACLAILAGGAVAVPIDAQLGDEVLSHILKDSEAKLIFTAASQVERLEQIDLDSDPRLVILDGEAEAERSWQSLAVETEARPPEVNPDETAVLFYTSGTTGPPKGVPLAHKNLIFQLDRILEAGIVTDDDRLLLPLPLHHVYPFVFGFLAPLRAGLPVVLPWSLTGPQVIRALQEGQATLIIGVPRLYRALYDGLESQLEATGWIVAPLLKLALKTSTALRRKTGLRLGRTLLYPLHQRFGPALRTVASGGSKLDPDLAWKLEGLGWQVGLGYGLTETAPLLTLNPPGQARLGSVGRPLEDVALRLDTSVQNEEAEPAGDDPEEGEILAKGPNVFGGYWRLPEKTEEVFSDGWFRTGDRGYFDEDGYLYVTGRISTMIITESGEKIQPDELEAAYAAHPAIREAGILQKENRLVGLIVPERSEIEGSDGDQLEAAVRQAVDEQGENLASYQRLADYTLTRQALPRTRLGKIRRHLLEERYDQARQSDGLSGEAARPISVQEMSDQDQALLDQAPARKTWEWLTRRFSDRRLTPDSNLQLDLGVDSLEWLNLSLEIRDRLGVTLDESDIAEIDTVRDLLQTVSESSDEPDEAAQAAPLEEPETALSEDQLKWLEPLGSLRAGLARILFGLNRLLMGSLFRLQVRGLEHIPDQAPFILAPNHASYLDPFALAAAFHYNQLRHIYWVGWTGVVTGNPINRFFTRLGQALPVDPEGTVMSSLAFAAAVLERGQNLVLFPEGRRSDTGEILPFKAGVGLLLTHFRVPVLPVYLQGAHEALPPGKFWPRLNQITVVIGPPLRPPDLEQQGQGDQPQEQIADALRQHLVDLVEE